MEDEGIGWGFLARLVWSGSGRAVRIDMHAEPMLVHNTPLTTTHSHALFATDVWAYVHAYNVPVCQSMVCPLLV